MIIFTIGTAIHFRTLKEFKVPDEWIENIRLKCGDQISENFSPESDNYEKFMIGLGVFWCYFACVIE